MDKLPATTSAQIKGHFDALRGMQHYLSADGENALKHLRTACENIPMQHKRARVFANIFRIHVLALQAILHDSQDDEPAAVKKLTEGLALAERGSFIRLFVDLGPQMVDLLKQLIEQNVAVDYIGRILAAFKEDED